MLETIELKNHEIFECCSLNRKTGEMNFYKGKKKTPGFSGLYYKADHVFFAVYPSEEGPLFFYENKEYKITKDMSIKVLRQGNSRRFDIDEYGIKINYKASPYIGFDLWSNEVDVDLFYMIAQNYVKPSFYEQYTCATDARIVTP